MTDIQIFFDGTRYYTDIKHPGLSKYERIRGRDKDEVSHKAYAKLTQWNEAWQKKVEQEDEKSKKELLKTRAGQALAARKDQAVKRTHEAQDAVASIKSILAHTLTRDDRINWETLQDRSAFPKPKPQIPQPTPPTQPSVPAAPVLASPKYQPSISLVDSMVPGRKQQLIDQAYQQYRQDYQVWEQTRRAIENQFALARQEHQRKLAEWQQQMQAANARWEAERAEYQKRQAERNASVDLVRKKYAEGLPEAIVGYCQLVLWRSEYPSCITKPACKLDYNPQNKIMVVECTLPTPDTMPTLKEVKYVQSRDALEEVLLLQATRDQLYDDMLYQIALRTLHELYEADVAKALDLIAFNGWVNSIDRSTGNQVNACVLSLQAKRDEFLAINLSSVDPKSCFRMLKGVGSSKLHGLASVAPVLQLKNDDPRFVDARAVAGELDESVNLAAMNWEDFEHLVRELFEQVFAVNGGTVKITRASRDEGVDAIANDPDPIRGGKTVIQAKCYTRTVGVSAVRDLYGTVMNEGAIKGILVTTSDYGPDAYNWAKDKPITLLNGSNLLHLLEQHGHKAKIDLEEARLLREQAGQPPDSR